MLIGKRGYARGDCYIMQCMEIMAESLRCLLFWRVRVHERRRVGVVMIMRTLGVSVIESGV